MNDAPEQDDSEEMNPTTPLNSFHRALRNLQYKPLTHEEERALFRKSLNGDEEARTFLISNHLIFALTFARQHGKGAEEDEIVSAANLALMIAIDKFDPSRANRFTSFLKPFIRGELARLWRSKNVVSCPRHLIPPTTVYFEDFGTAGDCSEGPNALTPLEAVLCSGALLEPDSVIQTFDFKALDDSARLKKIWRTAENILTKGELRVFKAIYKEGLSFSELAKKLKCSRQAIEQAHTRAFDKILARFK